MQWISYSLADKTMGDLNIERRRNSLVFKYPCKTTTCTNYNISLLAGLYRFECFGGGDRQGTAGAYTSGVIKINETKKLFLYLGMNAFYHYMKHLEVFNVGFGNISASRSGGGATDIRLEGGRWESFESLRSRIMVAAGSGSCECGIGGSGGDLIGINGKTGFCKGDPTNYTRFGIGAMQNGSSITTGFFGYSYNFTNVRNVNTGGGGYYGGGKSNDAGAGSGGGSSFISGHKGCDAITENSTKENIVHTGNPFHYSGVFFYNSVMKNGDEYFFDQKRNIIKGNIGKGMIIITKLNALFSCKSSRRNSICFSLFNVILMS